MAHDNHTTSTVDPGTLIGIYFAVPQYNLPHFEDIDARPGKFVPVLKNVRSRYFSSAED